MRRVMMIVIMGMVILIGSAVRMSAHHAFAAEFDANKPVSLRGTVTSMEWINPHAWIHIKVSKPDGKAEDWSIEGGPPNALLRRGFTRESLKTGTVVLVQGFQASDGSLRANGRNLTFSDGRQLFLGSTNTGAPDDPK